MLDANLTVPQGTINGLIYANIVRANKAVFFPPGDTNILTAFIAWLNLNLGIGTCFADGLNGYWKTCMAAVCVHCLHLDHYCHNNRCLPLQFNGS